MILDQNYKHVKTLYQGYKYTTNNRMELMAVLETLKYFDKPSKITIVSDSKYVVDSITNGSAKKGIEEQDYNKKNLDLGFEVVNLLDKHDVTMVGTKGHVGNQGNEEADKGCTFAAQCLNLPEDIGTINSN